MSSAITARDCVTPGRRRARRTYLFSEVRWSGGDETRTCRGVLVGASETGVALITEHGMTPRPGTRIAPSKQARHRRWHRPVAVVRVDPLSDRLDLVAGRYHDA